MQPVVRSPSFGIRPEAFGKPALFGCRILGDDEIVELAGLRRKPIDRPKQLFGGRKYDRKNGMHGPSNVTVKLSRGRRQRKEEQSPKQTIPAFEIDADCPETKENNKKVDKGYDNTDSFSAPPADLF